MLSRDSFSFFFFFNDTATTEIYTLSLHDALPIFLFHPTARLLVPNEVQVVLVPYQEPRVDVRHVVAEDEGEADRKSTRLNSSHGYISYAVFCLKKKKKNNYLITTPNMSQPAAVTQ